MLCRMIYYRSISTHLMGRNHRENQHGRMGKYKEYEFKISREGRKHHRIADEEPKHRKSRPLKAFLVLTSREALIPKSLRKAWRHTGIPGSAKLRLGCYGKKKP